MIRVNSEPYVNIAALIEVSEDGNTITFDPDNDFIDLPGGMAKFTVRYDPESKLYLSLVNNNIDPDGSVTQRNMVSLIASADMRNWEILKNVVQCDRPINWDESLSSTGFQYIDWHFDGDDILFVSRTAYDSNTSNPYKAWHNANLMTFHRIENYASLCPEVLLVDSFENDFSKWTDGGTTDWNTTTYTNYSGNYSAHTGYADNDLISDNINASG